jgi:hypothetical protein
MHTERRHTQHEQKLKRWNKCGYHANIVHMLPQQLLTYGSLQAHGGAPKELLTDSPLGKHGETLRDKQSQ